MGCLQCQSDDEAYNERPNIHRAREQLDNYNDNEEDENDEKFKDFEEVGSK
jgi:hypothetical protein